MFGYGGDKHWQKIGFGMMTFGLIWFWTFNQNPHVLIRYFSHQGYILTWMYFLAMMMNWGTILNYSLKRFFQLNLTLQAMITLVYWIMIHGPSIQSGKLSSSNIWWNVYVHTIPLLLLVNQIYVKRPKLSNTWKDTLSYYFFFAIPVNIAYSLLQKPVYRFLKYNSFFDLFKILLGALILFLIQQAEVSIVNKYSSKVK